jgi:hypothetical protein
MCPLPAQARGAAGGAVLFGFGVYEVKQEVIPGIKQAFACEP